MELCAEPRSTTQRRVASLVFRLQTRFHAAAESVKTFKAGKSVPNDDKLKVYGLFKQATIGDVNTDRPGGFLNFEANAKWDAWNALKGKSKDAAMTVCGA
jgi:diazepam-binding inhibitor (GABA receptor modulating acyl-CoA-binding protein)